MNGIHEKAVERPLVSVIIVNWNGKEYLDDCLSSLKIQSYRDYEVILVDNCSSDDSIAFVNIYYQDFVHIINFPKIKDLPEGITPASRRQKGGILLC